MKKISTTGSSDTPNGNVKCERRTADSLLEVAAIITEQNWCPAIFKDDYRKKDNFVQAHYIGLDVDEFITIDEAKAYFKDFAHIIQPSKSHQIAKGNKPAQDRFRVVLELAEPITSHDAWLTTMQQLFLLFPFIDLAAMDPARFFYKGHRPISVNVDGYRLTPGEGAGKLSAHTLNFIQSSKVQYNFNSDLYKVAKDFQQQGYEQHELEKVLEGWTVNLPGNYGKLDYNDEVTINRAYAGAPRHEPRIEKPADRPHKIGIDEALTASRILIDPYFLQAVTDEAATLYRITDQELKIVTYTANEQLLERHVASLVLNSDDYRTNDIDTIIRTWHRFGPAANAVPKAYAWGDSEEFTFHKINLDLQSGPYPAWEQFLKRLSSSPMFMAFVWSCFEPKHEGRQLLWLYGPKGQDGKSAVLNAISNCFGPAKGAINNATVAGSGKQFVLAPLLGKRVVVYPDCKDLTFPMRETTRSITSGDLQPIERKGKDAFSAHFYARLMVASNYPPKITSVGADISRLMLITVSESKVKGDLGWIKDLTTELPQFLYDCRKVYEEVCPTHDIIELDDSTKVLVESAHMMFEEVLEIAAEKAFEFGADYTCSASEYNSSINEVLNNVYEKEDFRKYLINNKGMEYDVKNNRGYYIGLRPIRSRHHAKSKVLSFKKEG